MKINVKTRITEYDGSPIPIGNPADGNFFDLRLAIVNAINHVSEDKPMLSEDKSKTYALSVKIYGGNSVDLTASEIGYILDKAKEAHVPLVLGRMTELLDPPSIPPTDKTV